MANDRSISEILDRSFPLSQYSPEDRLHVLIFHLQAKTKEPELRSHARTLGAPDSVVDALTAGDMYALHIALREAAGHGSGWPMLASLLSYGGGLAADYDVLKAAFTEYEEVAMDPRQRRRLPLSPTALEQRGYQHSGDAVEDAVAAATDPRRVTTHKELIKALKCLRINAGSPSLRELDERCLHIPEGADLAKHQHRSYGTIGKVLKIEAGGPQLIPVLAFVRGCGVTDLEELLAWERACTRIAIALEQSGRGAAEEDRRSRPWRSPTGPNPAF